MLRFRFSLSLLCRTLGVLVAASVSSPAYADNTLHAPTAPVRSPGEVVVAGSRSDALVRASGSDVQVTAKELKRAQPFTTSEMLRRVPGLNVRQEDSAGLRLNVGLRGLNPTRGRLILVLEDGVPAVVSPYGEPELYSVTPIERVQSIDVIKGSSSLLYGPQTIGGVINFRTLTPPSREEWSLQGDLRATPLLEDTCALRQRLR